MTVSSAATPPLDHTAVRKIIFGVLLAMALSALEQTIVATALLTIGRDLGNIADLSWVVTAYLLAGTAVMPLYGKLSDVHGRRRMLLVSISVFVVGSAACALAPTMTALILARALQGLGGGGLISLAQTVIADVVAPRERGRYQGYIGGVFATGSVGGPILGGFFADHLHWTLIFWINLPLGLLALAISYHSLKALPRHDRPHRIDLIGAALMVAACVALLLGLTWGGTRFPWLSLPTLGLFGGTVVFGVLFFLRQQTAPEPFLPLDVMRNGVVATGIAAVTFAMGTLIGLSVFVPLYLDLIRGVSVSGSGFALIPLMGSSVAGAVSSGRLMMLTPRYKRLPTIGLTLASAACLLLAADNATLPLGAVLVLLAVVGSGLGTVFPVTTVSVQNAVLPHQLGTTTGVMNFFRSLGGAVVVAVFGAIVLGFTAGSLPAGVPLEAVAHQSPDLAAALVDAFRWVFAAAALFLALSLAFLLLMEERPLRSGAQAAPAE